MAKQQGDIRYIQGVFDSQSGRFLGVSDPSNTGDGVDYPIPTMVLSEDNTKIVSLVNPDGTYADIGELSIGREIFTSGTSETSISNDNNKQLISNSSSNSTYTLLVDTCPNGMAILMRGIGLVTISAGAGVTFISTQNQTFTRGDVIYAIPTGVSNEFLVKVA